MDMITGATLKAGMDTSRSLKARELVCDPIIASVEILFVETGMFSDIGVDR
jgi:hypothetical protein